mmetsp:Transcript_103141/g.295945  ORF Transcript_103141/g.295945 Transcript_103141/m.295945 type:complete len:400 (-) Transcript_103141:89-1288(-)
MASRTRLEARINALEEEGRAKDEQLKAQEAVIQGLLTTVETLGATVEKAAEQTRVLAETGAAVAAVHFRENADGGGQHNVSTKSGDSVLHQVTVAPPPKRRKKTSSTSGSNSDGGGGGDGRDDESEVSGETMEAERRFCKDPEGNSRKLLKRFKPGIGSMGGGLQNTHPKPRSDNPMWNELGQPKMSAMNGTWQPYAPEHAGKDGYVDTISDQCRESESKEFDLFMSRVSKKNKRLGWEYLGTYKWDEGAEERVSAISLPKKTKEVAMKGLIKSTSDTGWGKPSMTRLRQQLDDAIAKDDQFQPDEEPTWNPLEPREPTEDEKQQWGGLRLSTRARALGYMQGMSHEALARIAVEIDEYHELFKIKFTRYNEQIYSALVGIAGATTQYTVSDWLNDRLD